MQQTTPQIPQKIDVPIHDIKPLVAIQDYSLYYFIALVVLATIVLLGLAYLAYRYLKARKKFNIRKEHFKRFKSVDLNDPKKAAYELTKYGATFKDDDERHLRAYENMLEHLQQYKYKKEVAPFDSETKHFIELYEAMIDV